MTNQRHPPSDDDSGVPPTLFPLVGASASDVLKSARQADREDPLADWRSEFAINDDSLIYLDGNSLGMPPRRTAGRVHDLIARDWASRLIHNWEQWLDLPQQVGNELAPVIGATVGEVVVHDSTTVNLYQLVDAARRLRPDRSRLAVAATEFPTDRYIVESIASDHRLVITNDVEHLDDVAVVVRSMIDYRTAQVVDIAAEQAKADAAGALIVWDLSHAAGLHPIRLNAVGAKLAVGCTYKYLNGGPGAPAFTYVAHELIDTIDQPLKGWFSQTNQFRMEDPYAPRPDIGRLLVGTPSILALVAAQVGIGLTARAGIERIYSKSQQLGEYALTVCDELNLVTHTPRAGAERGGHISVHHPHAQAIVDTLASDHNIIADFREPDVIRLGMSPLTTRFIDVAQALLAIARLADTVGPVSSSPQPG